MKYTLLFGHWNIHLQKGSAHLSRGEHKGSSSAWKNKENGKKKKKDVKTLNFGAFNSVTSTSALQPQRSLHHLPNYSAVMFTPGLKTSPKEINFSPKLPARWIGHCLRGSPISGAHVTLWFNSPLWRELLNFNAGVAGTKMTFMRAQNTGLSPLHLSVSLFCTCCWSLLSWIRQVCEPHLNKVVFTSWHILFPLNSLQPFSPNPKFPFICPQSSEIYPCFPSLVLTRWLKSGVLMPKKKMLLVSF